MNFFKIYQFSTSTSFQDNHNLASSDTRPSQPAINIIQPQKPASNFGPRLGAEQSLHEDTTLILYLDTSITEDISVVDDSFVNVHDIWRLIIF